MFQKTYKHVKKVVLSNFYVAFRPKNLFAAIESNKKIDSGFLTDHLDNVYYYRIFLVKWIIVNECSISA